MKASIAEWHGNGATIIDHNTAERRFAEAHTLVTATTDAPLDGLMPGFRELCVATRQIGDVKLLMA